jgi:endonuclease YncB( thermonuclease family)
MKKMLDRRERVKLIRDRTQDNRDAFGRLLRYVEDGRKDVGKAQVGKGWAKVVKFDGRFKRIRSYRKAQRRAKSNDRGVWSLCGGNFHMPSGQS